MIKILNRTVIIVFICAVLAFNGCTKDVGPLELKPVVDTLNKITYTNYAANVINNNCVGCHGAGTSNPAPGELHTYAAVKLKINDGSFANRVFTLKNMPMGSSLAASTIDSLQRWVNAGAPQ